MSRLIRCLALALLTAVPVSAQTDFDAAKVWFWDGGLSRCAVSIANGAPSGGATCDVAIDYSTGDLYSKVAGVWKKVNTYGTVTSVGLSVPSEWTVSGSPVTTSGTLSFSWTNPVTVPHGGTNKTSWTAHTALVGNGTSTPTEIAGCTNGVLRWSASSSDPTCDTNPTVTTATATTDLFANTGAAGTILLGGIAADRSYGGLWLAQGSPSFSNYAFLAHGGVSNQTFFNVNAAGGGTGDIEFRVNNGTVFTVGANGAAVGIGGNTAPTYPFEVKTSTPSDWAVDGSGNVGTTSFVSQTTGWRIDQAGRADVRYLYTDELRAKVFTADQESVLAGSQRITKSYSTISQTFTCPALGSTSTLWVKDAATFGDAAIFVSSDTVVIRSLTRSAFGPFSISDCVGVVTSYTDGTGGNAGQQSWTFTRNTSTNGGAMSASTTVPVDTLVQDLGVSGNGYVEATAVDGAAGVNAPYTQIVTWATAPVSANLTTRCRLGNLRGITSTAEYGLLCGDFGNHAYVRFSDQAAEIAGIKLSLYSGSTETVRLDPAVPSFAMGATLPTAFGTGAGIWFGNVSGTYKARIGDPSGAQFAYDGTAAYVGDGTSRVTIEAAGVNVGSTGSIRGGQTAYNTGTGFWIGQVSGTPKFSLGSSSGDHVNWSGSALEVQGSVKVGPSPTFAAYSVLSSTDADGAISDTFLHVDTNIASAHRIYAATGFYGGAMYAPIVGVYYQTLGADARGIGSTPTAVLGVSTSAAATDVPLIVNDGSHPPTSGYALDVRGKILTDTEVDILASSFGYAKMKGGSSSGDGARIDFLRGSTTIGEVGTRSAIEINSSNAMQIYGNTSEGVWVTAADSSGEILFATGGTTARTKIDANGDYIPLTDNTQNVGVPAKRFSLVRAVTITSGDLAFENGWTITETSKVGIAEEGLAVLDSAGALVFVLTKDGFRRKGGAGADDVDGLAYVQTTAAQRAGMDAHPEQHGRAAPAIPMPNPAAGQTNTQRKAAKGGKS